MSSRTIDSVVGAAEGCSLFAVTGGEPLLERESVLEMFERISAPSVLFTNGTLMDTGTAAALRRTNTSVLVSLDGDSFRHDSLRRYPDGRGSWRNAVEGIRISKAEGLQVGISMVLREHNVEGLGETLSILYEEFRPASFGLNLLHYTGYGFDGPSPESYAGAMREAWRFARRTGSYVDQVARRLLPVVTGIPRYRDCEAMGGKAVYFPDGSRSCCVNWLGRSDPEPFWSERVPLRSPECSGCAALCICGGGCAWDGENLGGPGRMDARNCAWTMALLEEILLDVGLTFRGRTPSREELSKEYSPLLPDRSRVLGTSMGHME
jgi:sulfatase maturation enzyme AslB (radical SAM superfamily)